MNFLLCVRDPRHCVKRKQRQSPSPSGLVPPDRSSLGCFSPSSSTMSFAAGRLGLPVLLVLPVLLTLLCGILPLGSGFNLETERPSVFSGPERSYFGFSVDFFLNSPSVLRSDILVGAPRANASSSSSSAVVEGGAVYTCPWNHASCQQLQFDNTDKSLMGYDDRENTEGVQMEFKSKQWFGASVRSDGEHILWSTFGGAEREPVGTCFLKKGATVVEYSPCRSDAISPEGQGFCQAGFSVDFLKKNNRVVVGGPGSFYWQDYVTGVPRGDKALGYVNIFNGNNMDSMVNFTGTQVRREIC
ncbi:Integrin alpha-V [Dissostichus eleginoides]|uniref:Integrin alpha-V n=1 Tax=Dissostichus eleginoides TaxID=100907 RepID=A0AAD9CM20_DISEL|nr:Integrin alpha-V [Dissostichus eleginoides]